MEELGFPGAANVRTETSLGPRSQKEPPDRGKSRVLGCGAGETWHAVRQVTWAMPGQRG